jgi:transcriptional antiterminator RfaH
MTDDFENMDETSPTSWYLVSTKPRQEKTALTNLTRQGYICYLPLIRIERIRNGKLQLSNEPLFSRYLFVQLDTSGQGKSWSPIRSTLGVSHLVKFGMQPARISNELVNQLKTREAARPTTVLFHPGDTVVVTAGPFSGIEAIYQTADAEQRSMILLNLLSKNVPLRVDTALLRKVA